MTEEEALARLLPKNDDAPHRAIVWVEAEVHELTKHGECTGSPKFRIERFPIYLDGADKFIAIRQVNELLEQTKGQCHSNRK